MQQLPDANEVTLKGMCNISVWPHQNGRNPEPHSYFLERTGAQYLDEGQL